MRPACCVVTRPAAEAATWVRGLRQEGFDALALPLITVEPVADAAPVSAAWARMADYDAVMFVSAAAAAHAFARRPPGALLPRQAWAPGPGTAAALRRCGVPEHTLRQPAADSAQWDSEALWRVVGPGVAPGAQVLVVRGEEEGADASRGAGREWLAGQLRAAGAGVDYLVAYRRGMPAWDAGERERAAALQGPQVLWLFSSSQAVGHLGRLLPGQDWSATPALATHPRIAEAARRAGFGVVWPSRPAMAEVVATLKSAG